MSRNNLLQCATAAFAGSALLSISAAAFADPPSPLTNAKSYQVTETISMKNDSGSFAPALSSVVTVSGDKVKISRQKIDASPAANAKSATEIFLDDGKSIHEYDADANEFYQSAARPLTSPLAADVMNFYKIEMLNVLFNPTQKIDASDRKQGAQRTVSETTLDGKPMQLTDISVTQKIDDGVSIKTDSDLYTDASTGLPYRAVQSYTRGGSTPVVWQVDFKDWNLSPVVSDDVFAWNPPTGAKEHVDKKILADGTTAPDFAATTPDGKIVHLSDFKGKTVIVDFWATWCGPCQQSLPHLESVYKQLKNKNVAVLAVCVWDNKDAYTKWLGEKKGIYTFPIAFPAGKDGASNIPGLYNVPGIPSQFVIGKDGKIAAGFVGYEDGDTQLETALASQGVEIAVAKPAAH